MGHRWRNIDQVISCQRDIHSGKIKQLFFDLLGFSSDWANLFLTVAEDTFPSPVGVEQDGNFGSPATRSGDGKTAIPLFTDCKRGLAAGDRRIRFAPEAICRLKQLKNQRKFETFNTVCDRLYLISCVRLDFV